MLQILHIGSCTSTHTLVNYTQAYVSLLGGCYGYFATTPTLSLPHMYSLNQSVNITVVRYYMEYIVSMV